jgi:predicted RNase H-like HicB family nuclease
LSGYAVAIEHEGGAWGAYAPDLAGGVATGSTRDEVERRIHAAIPAHIALMREAGEKVPEPTAAGVLLVPAS